MKKLMVTFLLLSSITMLNAQDTWTLKDIDLEMIKCPSGEFMMGSPKNEKGREVKEVLHKVTLSDSFMIGKYEVTQKQYKAVMGKNPSKFKKDSNPVELVSWNDAKEFCEKLNSIYSSTIPSGFKFDLPTEAQWEYACRANTNTALNNGKDLTTEYKCENLDEVGWYDKNSKFTTHPVGQKQPNAWGIFDMHGNVYEWCRDYDSNYKEGEDVTDPLGPDLGKDRIIRGGSYSVNAKSCRSALRLGINPKTKDIKTGFRVVLIPGSQGKEINFASTPESVSQPNKPQIAQENTNHSQTVSNTTSHQKAISNEKEKVVENRTPSNKEEKKDGVYTFSNFQMVYCKPGKFKMGTTKAEKNLGSKNELDIAEITIDKDFYIGQYEVTQNQYLSIMGENPSRYIGNQKPIESITYYNAIEFCKKLNEITKDSRPAGYEFNLPSEIQWEYACRAGTESSFNNGKQINNAKGSCKELDEIAWYKANSETKTHDIGNKKPNNWKIYDMHGNVAEWCLDAYNGNELAKEVNNDCKCIVRGGAYFYEPINNCSNSRGTASPNALSSGIGFRVALVQVK